ncbi:MAG: NADH-quinone oxidoreductase subunit C [Bacteroidetes bacterium]|nr:NADH-quinone oxidoreductase subunit C [Bacteroidota bacterium]
METEFLLNSINDKFEAIVKTHTISHGILTIETESTQIKDLIKWLKKSPSLNFNFLTDICAVQYPDQGEREFAVVYHLHNLNENFRLRIKIFVGRKNMNIPSITDVFSGANWMERETYDFFGIIFEGHPDLRRILNLDDLDYFPMRKEYKLEDGTRTDKDDRFFGRKGNEKVTFDNKKALARDNG